ncbi:MAG: DUF4838 domain-containing protein, partial [Candidatus Hydrogenedentes bacterium]|nr:DUF4838 domain-containing protein [Candidatus Hydrogenedentota bacterium]
VAETKPAAAPSAPEQRAEGDFLVRGGESAYRIVIGAGASASEQQAAKDIQGEVEAATGVRLPIDTGEAVGETPSIVVGMGPAARALGVDPARDALGEQGYVLKTIAPHVVVAGTPEAGTLYGAYDFLERALGLRWLAPGVTRRGAKDVVLPALDVPGRPAFQWRHINYTWPGGDDAFLARQRANDGGGGAGHSYGAQYAFHGRAHSYFNWVSPGEFFADHPDYFSEIGGERIGFETQLCLTHPDVLELVASRMIAYMGEHPEFRQYNFSQMDYYNYCECAKCRELNARYKTSGGTQFWFVNQLAERTSKVYPDKLIGTLAYIYTEEPPHDLIMHPNVAVWLCHMYPSCDSHPIATCPLNADYKRRAEAWSKICSHLYVWHYVVDFAHYFNPFPNLRAMAADMRFYRDIGVEGIFLQAMGHGGGGGEFSLLRGYYGSKLLWNPDEDPNALIQEFLDGYYGAAAGPIGRYIALLHDKVESENVHMHLYTNPAQGYMTDDVLVAADGLFNEAEAVVAQDADLLERVKVARMPLTYARAFPRNGYRIETAPAAADGLRTDRLIFNGPLADASEIEEFVGRMARHGFQTIREWGGDPAQMRVWPMLFSAPMDLPVIENAHLAVQVAPILGARALTIVDKKSGQCITAHDTAKSLFFPFCGGEESRVGGQFAADMSGNMTPFMVAERTPAAVTLRANDRGLDIARTLSLAPDAPVLIIRTEVTNATDNPIEARVRSHLELDLGRLEEARVAFTTRDGRPIEKDMKPIVANLREGERYADQDTPNGSWTMTGSKGVAVTQRFSADTTSFAWLYAYPADLNVLEVEIQDTPATVGPKQSHVFSIEIEVR